ncbi:hypothetical protein D3C81_2247100 [compost metagenome]
MQNNARTNSTMVPMMVSHLLRIHHSKPPSNARPKRPGSASWALSLSILRICTPSTGAKNTATTQDTISATAITANRV